jgi:hypothetical protein
VLFEIAALHHVIVWSVLEARFNQVHEIALMLDSLGRHIFVNSVEWIPNQPLHLAVACNVFVKIYGVLVDVICPHLNFVVPEGDFFTPTVFALRAKSRLGCLRRRLDRLLCNRSLLRALTGPPWFTTSCRARPLPCLNSQ